MFVGITFRSLVLYFVCHSYGSRLERNIEAIERSSTDRDKMIECTNLVKDGYFDQIQNIEIIWETPIDGFVENLGNIRTIIKNVDKLESWGYRSSTLTTHVIIFLKGNDRNEDLESLRIGTSGYQNRVQFMINVRRKFNSSEEGNDYVNGIVDYLIETDIWDAIITRWCDEGGTRSSPERDRIGMFTYEIYCARNLNELKIIKIIEHGNCEANGSIDKLIPTYVNFNECPVNLATINVSPYSSFYTVFGKTQVRGLEGDMINVIVDRINATPNYLRKMNGMKIRNSTKNKSADLGWGCVLQLPIPSVIYSRSYIFVQSMIVVPESSTMPLWKYLALPFDAKTWITLSTVVCVPVAVKLIVPTIRRQFFISYVLLGFFGIGPSRIPKRLSQRLYFLSWTIFAYVVTQAYLASLAKFFILNVQQQPIQTLDELEATGIVVGGSRAMREQFQETNPRIYRDWKLLTEVEYFENLDELYAGTNGIATYAPTYNIRNITRGKETSFQVIPQHISFYPIGVLMPSSSRILRACNRVIEGIVESGIFTVWESTYTRANLESETQPSEDRNRALSLAHLRATFLILITGYILGTLAFIFEISLRRVLRRDKETTI